MMSKPGPIRIIHVVTYMGRGGLETMIMNYYRHMDRSKIQFDFLVHRDFRADYDDEIEALGGRIFRIPRLIPWSSQYHCALNNFLGNHPEYKIIHVHQDCLSSVILKAAKRNDIPVRIAHSHNSNQDRNLKYPIKLYYKRKIPAYATHLFACGKEAGDWMFGNGASYHILNNAIDARRYTFNLETRAQVRNQLQIDCSSLVIGHVGRFRLQKNHTFLIDIFAEVKKRKPNSILLLVGDGKHQLEIQKKVQSLGIENSVIFTGSRSDVPDLMQAMDCFVFPSLYEGLPVTLIEAQAAGLPCIISENVPTDCVKTSLVYPLPLSKSPELWANKILEANQLPRQNTSKQIIDSGFDINTNAEWLQNFYFDQFLNASK